MATATRTVGPPASPRTDPAAAETRASRSDRSMLLGLAVAAALIVGGILVVALFVGGVFDSGHGSTPSATSSPSASTPGSAPPSTGTTATSYTISSMPTSTTTPIAPSTTPSSPPARPPQDQPTSSYSGQTFSIQYPVGWTIKNAESPRVVVTDTTIVSASDPNVLLRVDVSPNTPGKRSPLGCATGDQRARATGRLQAARPHGAGTFEGYPAEHWEFQVSESGVLLQKRGRVSSSTATASGVAVLTQAPANQYAGLASRFASLRQTFAVN